MIKQTIQLKKKKNSGRRSNIGAEILKLKRNHSCKSWERTIKREKQEKGPKAGKFGYTKGALRRPEWLKLSEGGRCGDEVG